MANTTFQLRYSNTSSVPLTLTTGEPAYSNVSGKLYIGSNGKIYTIGGKYYTDIIDGASTTSSAGTLVKRAANGAIITNTVVAALYGNANTATTWQSARLIGVSGDATGRVSVNGSNNANIPLVLASTGVTPGTYGDLTTIPTFTVDEKGRITSVQNVTVEVGALISMNVRADTGANTILLNRDVLSVKGIDGIETLVVNSNSTILISGASAQDAWVRPVANSGARYANAAFIQANAAFELTNSAYGYAAVASYTSNSAARYANAAFVQANAAFEVANNAANGAGPAYTKANTASNTANSGIIQANGAFAQANAAFIHANSSFNQANSASLYANGAFREANTASLYANGAFALANLIFRAANSASSYANSAFETANSAGASGVGGFIQANAAFNLVNVAIRQANTGFDVANLAFARANVANTLAQGAYATANLKFNTAGGTITGDVIMTGNITPLNDVQYYLGSPSRKWHSLYVGPGSVNIGGVVLSATDGGGLAVSNPSAPPGTVIDLTVTGGAFDSLGNISYSSNVSGSYANAAFEVANNASIYANGAFIQANAAYIDTNAASSYANSAFIKANAAFMHANASYIDANSAISYANGAFIKANAAFAVTNLVFTAANTGGQTATASFLAANSASQYANGAFIQANSAFDKANAVGLTVQFSSDRTNLAWSSSNSVVGLATYASDTANTANTLATIAYTNALNGGYLLNVLRDSFVGDGSTTVFQFSDSGGPSSANSVTVNINGITQLPTSYTISANTVTFVEPPPAGEELTLTGFAFQPSGSVSLAQAAFDRANNVAQGLLDDWVRDQANNAFNQANAAFEAANTASSSSSVKGNTILLGANTAGLLVSNAVSLTESTTVTNGLAQLNQILGKLVPSSPPAFPSSTSLSVNSLSTYRMANFVQTDRTQTGGKSVAGGTSVSTVRRSASYTTNTFNDMGPGESGTITLYKNGSACGSVTLTSSSANGTYTDLIVTDSKDYALTGAISYQNFWRSFDVQGSGTVSAGWNEINVAHSGASSTSKVSWYYDSSSPGTPTFTSASFIPLSETSIYSSTVPHYTSATTFRLGANVSKLSGDMYPTSDTFLTGSSGGAFQTPSSNTYSAVGITTPLAQNLYVSSGSVTVNSTVYVVASGFSSSATGPSITVDNSYNTGSLSFTSALANTVLYKNGTSSSMEETSITFGSTVGTGSGLAARIVNPGSTDTPSKSASASLFNSQTDTLEVYDATIVAGILKHDQTNYSVNYLPRGPNLSSGRSGSQYFTFRFVRTSLSKFNIKFTGTIAGLWVALPGSAIDTAAAATNGWLDMSVAYGGAGVPSNGCALGGVVTLNSAVSAHSKTCTFGTVSSSDTATNEIYVRIKLASGQTVTALSLETSSN